MHNSANKSPFPLFSIAVISATALSYEILLTRLFAIIQYHHFAYMIISLALLGYGVSGTLLSIYQNTISQHFIRFYLVNIILFAFSSLACFLVAQHIAFNAEQMLWDYSQSLRLFSTYLLLMLPFLFVANAIGASLMVFTDRIGKLYGADLLGAGIGSISIIGLLFILPPNQVLPLLVLCGVASALIACWELRCYSVKLITPFVLLVVASLFIPANWLSLELSPYKSLPQLLRIQDTRVIASKSSPLGLIQVVESPSLPLRHAPGLSLNAINEPPPQLAVFVDGGNLSALNANVDNKHHLSFLDQQTSAAVYHLSIPNNVLVLGSGTGNDVLQARFYNAGHIDAVEMNPQLVELITEDYADYSGKLYQQPDITLHIEDARGFISRSKRKFDVIQITLLDSQAATSAGLYALSENYLYTIEAFKEYLAHLQPDGYLSITSWIKLPPRDNLKLFATAVQALRESGLTEPENNLIQIRSWQTSTLLLKNGIVNSHDVQKLQQFCNDRSFDTAYYPAITASQTNKFNILREPFFYQGAVALLNDDQSKFLQQYKFNLKPATDNQPYFSNFFKWQLFPEIMSLKESGGMPLMEWGYIILVATLVQALLASVILILAPLLFRKTRTIDNNSPIWMNLAYFTALGLGFLFIEIAFIQKFTLFLHHPLYSIAVIVAAFLLFAGWGSITSKKLHTRWGIEKSIKISVAGILLVGIIYIIGLDVLFTLAIGLPTVLKIIITSILIAPLAFFMGMPFPLALSFISEQYPKLVPWAWGINGCASVVSAVLAMLLAVHAGFTFVIVCALLLYLCAALFYSALTRNHQQSLKNETVL